MLRLLRTRQVFVHCMRCNLPQGCVGDTDYPRNLVTSMAFGASLFFFVFPAALYLREYSSFVVATNLTRIGLNYSEDEGWGVILSGGGSR